MILTCPQCQTRYEADASKFAPPGRKVKCAKCGNIWHQEAPAAEPLVVPRAEPIVAPAPAPVAEAAPEPEPAPAPQPVIEPEPQRAAYAPAAERVVERPVAAPTVAKRTKPATSAPRRIGVIAGWAGLVVVILVIGWSALTYRQQIATVWPQAASLYSALGLHVNTRGLDFVDVAYHSEMEDGQQVLAISGKLVNISARELSIPPIEVVLTDKNKLLIGNWNFKASAHTLRPGQQAAFLWRLSSPPAGARHLELRFAASGG
jgi:predicted Zn finger-like uncharacterized protein